MVEERKLGDEAAAGTRILTRKFALGSFSISNVLDDSDSNEYELHFHALARSQTHLNVKVALGLAKNAVKRGF